MKPKDNKQRLFEVMTRLDKTFKPRLNEELNTILNEENRPLSLIAREIRQDWKPVHPYAEPYVSAMSSLNSINDKYMFDSGKEIVARFLSNASSWRGETAKRIKTELKQMLGLKEELGEELENKYRAEVTGKGENVWSTNAMEYDTEQEAKDWLDGLSGRWFGYDMGRVVPVSTPRNQPVDMENDNIYQNFREGVNKEDKWIQKAGDLEESPELTWDKQNLEQAMVQAFETPPDYQMKNPVQVGDTVTTSDGDTVHILNLDPTKGLIKVKVEYSPENIAYFKKMGVSLKNFDFTITWSLKQFDAIVNWDFPINGRY
jgi:hypothetical protein